MAMLHAFETDCIHLGMVYKMRFEIRPDSTTTSKKKDTPIECVLYVTKEFTGVESERHVSTLSILVPAQLSSSQSFRVSASRELMKREIKGDVKKSRSATNSVDETE